MHQFLLQIVPLSKVRHNDLACYRREGFGARPVEEWPVYRFFQKYLSGDKDGAMSDYEVWYKDQLEKYHNTPKAEGGMHRGSLYSLIEERCGAPFDEVNEECKGEAIRERVTQRFQLLEVIQREGYNPERAERIDAVRKGEYVYLLGGHHRAAAQRALGKTELSGVLVFPNQLVYNLFNFLRNIKHGSF